MIGTFIIVNELKSVTKNSSVFVKYSQKFVWIPLIWSQYMNYFTTNCALNKFIDLFISSH